MIRAEVAPNYSITAPIFFLFIYQKLVKNRPQFIGSRREILRILQFYSRDALHIAKNRFWAFLEKS
ncbi:MAG: hypothetical protein CMN27_16630 [Salinisphaera sp.]|nr:hypothetical protein [Salinisphaera sp.]